MTDAVAARRRTLVLFAATMFLAGGAMFLARTARDALFLARFDRSALATMYVTSAFAVALPMLLVASLSGRSKLRQVLLTQAGFSVLLAAFAAAISRSAQGWPIVLLYNFVELFAVLTPVQVMTLAGDCFSTREAKRAFPLIGAAGVLGAIGFGFGASALLRLGWLKTTGLLWVAAALVGWAALLLKILFKAGAQPLSKTRSRSGAGVLEVLANPHVRIIAGMMIAATFIVSLVDFQFKAFTQAHFTTAQGLQVDAMSAFYGVFFGATYLAAAILQVLATGPLLQRLGVVKALAIFPVILLVGSAGLWAGLLPLFVLGVALKGADGFLRYGLHSSTVEMLYLPLPAQERQRAKVLVDGGVSAIAGGAAGLVISLMVVQLQFPPEALAPVTILAAVSFLWLILHSRKGYLQELLAGLKRIQPDAPVEHGSGELQKRALAALSSGLASSDPRELRMMLALVASEWVPALTPQLFTLLERAEVDIRARCVELLRRPRSDEISRRLIAHSQDPADEVGAGALLAALDLPEPELKTRVALFLEQGPPRRRAAAAAVLLSRNVADFAPTAEVVIDKLADSSDEIERAAAAEGLKELAEPRRYPALVGLLNDGSPLVQRAAMRAAGSMRSPETIPLLIYLLGVGRLHQAAAAALMEAGSVAIPELARVLADPRERVELRRRIPRILGRMARREALPALLAALDSPDRRIRRDAARGAAAVSAHLGEPLPESVVRAHLQAEVQRCQQYETMLKDLEDVLGANSQDMLRDALEDYVRQAKDNVLCLLALIYPGPSVLSVRASLKSADLSLHANALEALENILSASDRRRFLPLFEAGSKVAAKSMTRVQSAPEWLGGLLRSEDPWLITVALHTAAELGTPSLLEQVKALVEHPAPTVREAAARTLSCMLPADELLAFCLPLTQDGSDPVRRYTQALLAAADVTVKLAPLETRVRRVRPSKTQEMEAIAAPDAQSALRRLARSVRLALIFRCEGESLVVHQALEGRASVEIEPPPIPLSAPSIFERALGSKLPVLDEVDAITQAEAEFLERLGLPTPAMRVLIPVLQQGATRGLLYLDDASGISAEQFEAALVAGQYLAEQWD